MNRINFTIQINQSCELINHAMRTALQATDFLRRVARDGCRTFKSIQQSIGRYIMRIMPAWRLAFPGTSNRVYNPFCYCKGSFDLYVVVISKLSGPLTRCIFCCCRFSHLLEHKLTNDAEQILCFSFILDYFAASFFPALSDQLAKESSR